MFSQLFGKYLVDKQIISDADYNTAIEQQLAVRVKLGTIAIADGLLTEEEVESINKMQMQFDKRFGDIAVEKELLTPEQVDSLLKKQGNPYMQFIQALMEASKLTATVLEKTLVAFQKEKGFSDDDMTILKNDDIDSLIPIFAFSAKPYVTDLSGLVIRNINRFISRDFYIDRIKHVNKLTYSNLASQSIVGKHNICLAFAEEQDAGAFNLIASHFSGDTHTESNADTFDAVCEFINVNSGLFASELSEKKEIDMELMPVSAYKDQTVEGDFYILPIYIENRKINLIIAVDSEVSLGETPFTYSTKDDIVYDVKADSKGRVLLVDDSKMSRKMLRTIFEEAGYSIIGEATNGAEALDAYKEHKPDLVTLDITMPVMDGIEALKQLLVINPDVKAIMITAAGQQSKLIEALKIGAKKFITKPFEKEEIVTNIEMVMNED